MKGKIKTHSQEINTGRKIKSRNFWKIVKRRYAGRGRGKGNAGLRTRTKRKRIEKGSKR